LMFTPFLKAMLKLQTSRSIKNAMIEHDWCMNAL
jgi:hypothetical protein